MDNTTTRAGQKVAVYWDQENIVAGHYEGLHGKNSWRDALKRPDCTAEQGIAEARTKLRDARIDMDAIMTALKPGAVVINRAYGNWTTPWLRPYAPAIHRHAIDAIQMFPAAGTKNGADIRLALDVVNDLLHYPQITDVVVVGGDSDYIALVQHCHRHQVRFTSVTARAAASCHLQCAADETILYEDLISDEPASDQPVEPEEGEVTAVAAAPVDLPALLAEAISQLVAESATGWAASARIRPTMRRLDPTFTLPDGETIRALLDKHAGSLLEIRSGAHDREVRLVSSEPATHWQFSTISTQAGIVDADPSVTLTSRETLAAGTDSAAPRERFLATVESE